jgi:hypothetical protein
MILIGNDILKEITSVFADRPNEFPRGGVVDYPTIIDGWIKHLNANVLPYVTAGSIAVDESGHLTMHDREHVERVRQVAANIIGQFDTLKLSAFELTLLLVAIYIHDVGNILGRASHERNIGKALKAANAVPPIDTFEYTVARQIAGVHGGTVNGSKDTISTRPQSEAVSGHHIRSRLLASIVRLADELADDVARANRVQLAAGALPPGSEVYHVIAGGLHSQVPSGRTREILLRYSFYDAEMFKRTLGKGSEQVYLLDEIFLRSIKTYHEARYCSRFMRPELEFDRVAVDIVIFDEDGELLHQIKYTIAEHGYGETATTIYDLVPELEAYNGNGRLTPEYLGQIIADAQGQSDGQ